jgi:hypothetical protein
MSPFGRLRRLPPSSNILFEQAAFHHVVNSTWDDAAAQQDR